MKISDADHDYSFMQLIPLTNI